MRLIAVAMRIAWQAEIESKETEMDVADTDWRPVLFVPIR
jgi:hypothetical protein